jgi:hypothetical protein
VAFSFSAGVWFLKFNNTYAIRMAGMFMLFFPAWVFLISVYILVLNYRFNQEQDGVTFGE